MSVSQAQNIYMPPNVNSIVLLFQVVFKIGGLAHMVLMSPIQGSHSLEKSLNFIFL